MGSAILIEVFFVSLCTPASIGYTSRSSADYRNKVALLTNIIARYYSALS